MYFLSHTFLFQALIAFTVPAAANDNSVCRIVSDDDLTNADFLRDARNMLALVSAAHGISPSTARDVFSGWYRDYKGIIVDQNGQEVFLNTECLECDEDNIFAANDNFSKEQESFFKWFSGMSKPCPADIHPRIHTEHIERTRVILTILRARFPDRFGLEEITAKAANDNNPACT